MKRLLRITLGAASGIMASALASSSAYASVDSGCQPEWKLSGAGECSSTALLGPNNDTRVNLLMLLFDRQGAVGAYSAPDYYSEGRRGYAEPFNYTLFARTLGSTPKDANTPTGDNRPWGTRCFSNDTGAAAFRNAVGNAKGVSTVDAALLIAARVALIPQCQDNVTARPAVEVAVASMKSGQGQLFARYLLGAASFYDGDFESAQKDFSTLANANVPWLAETASYMQGRVALNRAMQGAFDEYGYLEKINNTSSLGDGETAFQGYLKAHPKGLYAASARGLLRKIYWLGGRKDKLLAEYMLQFSMPESARNMSLADLVQEFDNKLLSDEDASLSPAMVNDPVTLAVLDLAYMQAVDSENSGQPSPISRAEIEKQKPRFVGNDALYNYVLASHSFYVANKPADVLKLIPAGNGDGSYLGFSRQLLRALALEATGSKDARAAMVALVGAARPEFQRGAAELALAMYDERHGSIDNVFATNSVIRDPNIREILLRYHAGPALLRLRAADRNAEKQERDVALYTLLYKELTRGTYADFVKDAVMVPADAKPPADGDYRPSYTDISIFKGAIESPFGCASARGVAASLVANPKDAAAQLCLAEFVRVNDLDPAYYGASYDLDELPPKDELGGTPSQFAGKPFARMDIYKRLIADPAVSANNKAYALLRAVNCYGPGGNNGCGGEDVAPEVRKAWFMRLKKDFATTRWAKQQKYYW